MNQITVEHKPFKFLPLTRKIKTSHPEKWDEMTPEQLIIGASVMEGTVTDDRVIQLMTGLKKRIVKRLTPYQKLRIIELLVFLNDFTPYHEFIIPSIGNLIKPKPRLKDETFGCFIFAETYFLQYEKTFDEDHLCKFIASYYRDSDFSEDRINRNASLVKKAPDAVKQAIYINYILIRKYLAENYPYVFQQSDDTSQTKETASWLDVYDAIVKDDIVHQDQYAKLPINNVLRYLNNNIKSNRNK